MSSTRKMAIATIVGGIILVLAASEFDNSEGTAIVMGVIAALAGVVLFSLSGGSTQADSPAQAYLNSGQMKFRNEDWQGAFYDFSKAIELDPQSWMAYNNRGNTASILSDDQPNPAAKAQLLRQAVSDFEASIRINPDRTKNSKAFANRARDTAVLSRLS